MKKWETIREFIMITFATVIVAAAVFFFLMPSHVSVGSISGLAIVLGNFVPLKISAITFILNRKGIRGKDCLHLVPAARGPGCV